MTLLPRRTVADQVAAQLHELIRHGTWREWLPGERQWCKNLQVSRDTLRSALARLRHAGLITVRHGVGHRIVAGLRPAAAKSVRTIALLAPEPLARLRQSIALWIDELKDLLHAAGFELRFHHGRGYARHQPGPLARRLVQREPAAAWILVLSAESLQHWFMANAIPCVVAGSGCEGVTLPTVDLDYRAICRHATGVLLRAGHRRIALVNHRSHTGGDLAGEVGLHEAAQRSPARGVEARVVYHETPANPWRSSCAA